MVTWVTTKHSSVVFSVLSWNVFKVPYSNDAFLSLILLRHFSKDATASLRLPLKPGAVRVQVLRSSSRYLGPEHTLQNGFVS